MVVIRADLVSIIPVEPIRTRLSGPLGVDTEEILSAGGVRLVAALVTATLEGDILVSDDVLIALLDEVDHPSLRLEQL